MPRFPIAVFYDEWGVPKKLRYIEFKSRYVNYDGYWKRDLLLSVDEPIQSCIKEVPLEMILQNTEYTGCVHTTLVEQRLVALKLSGTEELTVVAYDGTVYNDTLQCLHSLNFNYGSEKWLLIVDWKGSIKWEKFNIVKEAARVAAIKVSGYLYDFTPKSMRLGVRNELRSDRVKRLVERETASFDLANWRYAFDGYFGLRLLEVPQVSTAVVSDFWNAVYNKCSTLQRLSCSRNCILNIESEALRFLKCPEVCYGARIMCKALEGLVIPKQLEELRRNTGVAFILNVETLPCDFTEWDMSGWSKLSLLDIIIGKSYLRSMTVHLPRNMGTMMIHPEAIHIDNNGQVAIVNSGISLKGEDRIWIKDAECLEELSVMANLRYETNDYEILLWRLYSLQRITINTLSKLTLSLSGLENVVDLTVSMGCRLQVKLDACPANVVFKVSVVGAGCLENTSILFMIRDREYKIVTDATDSWAKSYKSPVGCPTLLIYGSAESLMFVSVTNILYGSK